jgi:hypothetical protein
VEHPQGPNYLLPTAMFPSHRSECIPYCEKEGDMDVLPPSGKWLMNKKRSPSYQQ